MTNIAPIKDVVVGSEGKQLIFVLAHFYQSHQEQHQKSIKSYYLYLIQRANSELTSELLPAVKSPSNLNIKYFPSIERLTSNIEINADR
ncbi:hypothetical protein D3C84_833620 [compost metagenome]